ncbi:unnamed protein product [Nesidiocoris tenuis]|uniref:Uncharacterized protein n=1 Tax=Nesidiocoris tenuis TaxID=355587 RepID=A0A6H5GVV6_9HEMI|nr:unnamed protein product [Nesidiocoris tenuis]
MFQKPMISKTNVKIRSYGGYFTKAKGEAYLNCEYKNKKKQIRFLIVDQSESPIFGADSCEKFDLIKRLYQVRVEKDEPEKSAPNEVNKATAKKLKKILRDLNDDTEKEKFITKNIDVLLVWVKCQWKSKSPSARMPFQWCVLPDVYPKSSKLDSKKSWIGSRVWILSRKLTVPPTGFMIL